MRRGVQSGGARDDWVVRVPASSANLGSAFDAVALALDVHLEVTADAGDPAPETHPAVRAFREGGGVGPIAVRLRFPGGRGLGFSGAARVGGLVAAWSHQGRRLARAHETRHAIEAALAAGAFAAWLSGSGPSAAALVEPACAADVAAALPSEGRTRVLAIADVGATVTTRDAP